jgi:hypothetical protein
MTILRSILWLALVPVCLHAAPHKFLSTMSEAYVIPDRPSWKYEVVQELTLRFCNVRFTPASGHEYDARVSLICDTQDLSKFNTEGKIKQGVRSAGKRFQAPSAPEPEIKKLELKDRLGFEAVYVDPALKNAKKISDSQYPFAVVGMVRLGETAIGYQILTKDKSGKGTQELLMFLQRELK